MGTGRISSTSTGRFVFETETGKTVKGRKRRVLKKRGIACVDEWVIDESQGCKKINETMRRKIDRRPRVNIKRKSGTHERWVRLAGQWSSGRVVSQIKERPTMARENI